MNGNAGSMIVGSLASVIIYELDKRAGAPLMTCDLVALGCPEGGITSSIHRLERQNRLVIYRYKNIQCWFRNAAELAAYGPAGADALIQAMIDARTRNAAAKRWGLARSKECASVKILAKKSGPSELTRYTAGASKTAVKSAGPVIIPENVKIMRDLTPRPTARWQMLPDSNTPMFAAVGIGHDIQTGRAWG